MTPQEMIDEVSRQLRDSKNLSLFPIWLNMAAKWLAAKVNFRELHNISVTPITTVSGTRTYILGASVFRLYNVWIPAIPRYLTPISEAKLIGLDPKFNITQGDIYKYVWRGKNLDLFRVPAGIYDIYYSYFAAPATIASGDTTEYPSFPAQWHEYLVQRALTRGFMFEGNAQWATSELSQDKLFKELKSTIADRPDVFHVLESEDATFRLPRPSLPEHFPRV